MVVLTPSGVALKDLDGRTVVREPERITWTLEDAEKGGFEHFMLKEIFEQPSAIHETLLGRVANLDVNGFFAEAFTSVKLVACGTSYHAALVGKYILEEIARVPASAELASEYRYAHGPSERPLVKTFVTQLVALYLLALRIGLDRGSLGYEEADILKDELRSLPRAVQAVLNRSEAIERLAEKYRDANDMFYIGRHVNYPVAMEGALKLKEISYIHAEAYAAGELKHGPLALLTSATPVVAIVVRDHTYDKMRSNIGEVVARGSPVLAIASEGDREIVKFVDDVLAVPELPGIFNPAPVTVAMQLFAYHLARTRQCPIDKPRNLAKSVTVE